MIGRVLRIGVTAAVIGGVLISCGSGGRSTHEPMGAHGVSESVAGPSAPGSSRAQSTSTDHADPVAHNYVACKGARVWLGEAPGAIDFAVYCVAKARGEVVAMGVGRNPRSRAVHSPTALLSAIRDFRHAPAISGSGRLEEHGVCGRRLESGNRAYRSGISCEARADGPMRLHGRLWVRSTSSCAKRVVIQTYGSSECDGVGDCPMTLTIARLTNEVPRGC